MSNPTIELKLTSAEEMSLDDLIRMIMENHNCSEQDALRAIKNRVTLAQVDKPKPLTLHEANLYAKEKGFKLSKCVNNEYRVCPVDEDERSAYYTTDLIDAIDTINNWK